MTRTALSSPVRWSVLPAAVVIATSSAVAQDHTAHGAGPTARALGGAFELRTYNARPLPAEYPAGSATRLVGGALDLALVRPDSGRFTLRLDATRTGSDAARARTRGGIVRVRGDTLLLSVDGENAPSPARYRLAWTGDRALDLTDAEGNVWGYVPIATTDTAFTGVQSRGATVMGVDQYTSSHVFETLPDGGRIVLQRDSADAAGETTIRAHMADIARRFTAGDFSLPGQVHGMTVPGTAVMAANRARITYVAEELPRGAQVRITTRNPAALKAVHEFLAFQRLDHRAAGHDH